MSGRVVAVVARRGRGRVIKTCTAHVPIFFVKEKHHVQKVSGGFKLVVNNYFVL